MSMKISIDFEDMSKYSKLDLLRMRRTLELCQGEVADALKRVSTREDFMSGKEPLRIENPYWLDPIEAPRV